MFGWKRIAVFVAPLVSLVLLNTVVEFRWGGYPTSFRLHPDLFLVCAVLGGVSAFRQKSCAAVRAPAAVLILLIFIFNLCEALYPVYFGQDLKLRHHLWLVPNLLDLLYDSWPPVRATAVFVLILLGVSIALGVLFFLLEKVEGVLRRRRIYASYVIFGLVTFSACSRESRPARADAINASIPGSDLERLGRGLIDAYIFLGKQEQIDEALDAEQSERKRLPTDLQRLGGADVYVVFIESYGRAIWWEPSYRDLFRLYQRQAERQLEDAGLHVASRYVASPVKGGGSWLAHATFQSGFKCDNVLTYRRVLASDLTPLPSIFRRKGYRTFSVLPAVDVAVEEWPEGAYFDFSDFFWFHDFDYRGPTYGWSPIPDQYAVRRFHESVVEKADPRVPFFVQFVLTSSHPPFRRVPPYHEGDISTEKLKAFYKNAPELFFDNSYERLNDAARGYTEAIRYSLRSTIDTLVTGERDSLTLILGDHQPIATLAGTERADVPMHVITRDRELMERFLDRGFVPGLRPPPFRGIPMENILELVLRACSF